MTDYESIAETICVRNGMTLAELNASGRQAYCATLRAYIAYTLHNLGMVDFHIAKLLERNHASVYHMIKRAGDYLKFKDRLMMEIKQKSEL